MNLAVPELIWIVLSALLVLMMQAGFGCLESGLVRAKNSTNVVMKNLVDLCIATLAFWALGFGLMFGASQDGVFGTSHFFFDAQSGTFLTVGFFFQLMFCGTAVTIVSGAIAERVGFTGYAICTLLIALLVYPIFGHWVWGGGLGVPGTDGGEGTGWLATLGFVDFAGSTVVHSVGGWVSLALVLILGPRIGRFDNTQHFIEPHNLPLSMLGLLILWVGWFGFNGGSVLAWTDDVPIILINTLIAPAAAGLVAMIWSHYQHRRFDVASSMTGVIGGLVAITASANSVMPLESVFIGGVGGFLGAAGITWLERLKIDDSVGAIPAHLFAGIWGTLAVALFSDLEKIGTGLTRIEQFWIQGLGIAVAGLFTFGISYSVLFIINRIYPLRVSRRAEEIGLNIAEHGAGSALQNLLAEMEDHRASGDFTGRVRVEEGSDVAIIAQQYNQVLERIRRESGRRENVIKELEQARYEAEQAARSKSRFLAHMSHELRTPLNAIIGFASLMRMHPAKSVEEQARYLEYAGDIETSGRHLLRVINDILDFSRLEEDQVALKEELVLAADLIAYVNRMFKPLAEEKEISLIADSKNLSISISADEKLMRQTLINLLSNAIKFTPISGTIEIKGGVEADGRLAISVADSGPGIPPEKVEKAMRSFGQVDDGFTKVEQQGTGLGLPLARAFMRLHQGTLTVSNGPNGGAEITIRLPAKRVDPADPAIGALAY